MIKSIASGFTQDRLIKVEIVIKKKYADRVLTMVDKANKSLSKGKNVNLKIEEEKTTEANGYMWEICGKIAEHQGVTKEDVYRRNVREKGQFDTVTIKNEAADRFIKNWGSKNKKQGLGWFADIIADYGNSKEIMTIYGSSAYSSYELWVLTEEIVREAQNLGIETKTPEQLKEMFERLESYEKRGQK